MAVEISDVLGIVERQNYWRGQETINLIASENVQSPAIRQVECNDFMGRYAEGHPNTPDTDNRYYEGTCYIDEIESMATRELIELAGCEQADDEIIAEAVAMVRDRIGPVAAFKQALVVNRLPKTRSGKILRGTMRSIADGKPWKMPATIDDPVILDEITQALSTIGYPR